ncbi:tRNA1(Val) (adenine(37)-N6)-methyltransferase [Paraglaciecola sp. L1A13]|uniref:tRNA1(Val) (adenine(37)-N6)-methyltransferase n=1 Tax=Paraglaciecola sp. L1A13 TaxID=2686359 RepID=UPI00131D6D41|nr:methyltransferase [Paraglaciecola sp. L1A13]
MKRKGFQFKQFFIEHQDCAMKVGTDSIMLGSWVTLPHQVDMLNPNPMRILDIGTGSGLLAIMLAQKSRDNAHITAIDIDNDAINQAKCNIAASPWAKSIHAELCSLQTFTKAENSGKFDLIISNPPYFNSPLPKATSEAKKRIRARQTVDLSHQILLDCVAQLLSNNGKFYCILPTDFCTSLIAYASTVNLHLCAQLMVYSKPNSPALRCLLAFCAQQAPLTSENLTIYTQHQQYSEDYKALCQDYYLKF